MSLFHLSKLMSEMTVCENSPLDLLALVPELQDLRPRQHHNKIHRPPLKLQHVPDFNFTRQAGLTLDSTKNCSAPTEKDRLLSTSVSSEAVNNQTHPLDSRDTSPRTKLSTSYTSHHKRPCHQHTLRSNSRSETENQTDTRHQRTYIFPKASPATSPKSSTAHPTKPLTSTLKPLARSFFSFRPHSPAFLHRQHQNQTHHLSNSNSNSYLSPHHLTNLLSQWQSDKTFRATCQHHARTNPFPGLDMNHGWNRARSEAKLAFKEEKDIFPVLKGGPQEKVDVLRALRGWSWYRQGEGIQLVLEDLRGGFDVVFVGDGGNAGRGCAWAREPGSWWGAERRLGLRMSCRGGLFVHELAAQTAFLESQLVFWTESQTALRNQNHASQPQGVHRKRACDYAPEEQTHVCKRWRAARIDTLRFHSDAWRKRRREQERKAGRWLDGTVRMWRVWDEFFWVPDAGDGEWKRSYVRVVSGRNIWG